MIHNFGRADQVDREATGPAGGLDLPVLTPEQAAAAAGGGEVEVLDSRRLGGAWTLDRLWERLGIARRSARSRPDAGWTGEAVERVVFALVAQRALEPGSKLAATRWVGERVAIEECSGFPEILAYGPRACCSTRSTRSPAEIFTSVAPLLHLDLDIVFVDTTSTYWEFETADNDPNLAEPVADDVVTSPDEAARTRSGGGTCRVGPPHYCGGPP